MKKILFSTSVAICSAIGFTSFRYVNTIGPYYFQVDEGMDIPAGTGAVLDDNEVTYLHGVSEAACVDFGFDCVVTFATSSLTSGRRHLLEGGYFSIRNTIASRGIY
jgi:hypothetical protein